jgi:hypothetical protein
MARATPVAAKLERLLDELEREHAETLELRGGYLLAAPLDQVIGKVEAARELALAEGL